MAQAAEAQGKIREMMTKTQKEVAERTQRLGLQLVGKIRARNKPLVDGLLTTASEELKSLVQEKRAEREKLKAAGKSGKEGGKGDREGEDEAEEGFVEPPPELTLAEKLKQEQQQREQEQAFSSGPNPASSSSSSDNEESEEEEGSMAEDDDDGDVEVHTIFPCSDI